MDLNDLLSALRRGALFLILATAIGAIVGWQVTTRADRTYESSSVVLVGPLNTDTETMRASSSLAQTYAQLATSDSLLGRVADSTGVAKAELSDGVRATANGTTRFLTVRARAQDPEAARDVAVAVTDELISLTGDEVTRPEGRLEVVDPAEVSSVPVSPRGELVVPLAALAGLLGAAAVVLIFELTGDTAESAGRVAEAAEVRTLALPGGGPASQILSRRRRPDPLAVAATQVDLTHPGIGVIAVAGVSDDPGAVAVARHLVRTWAPRRPGVVLVDATGEHVELEGAPAPDEPVASASIDRDTASALLEPLTADGHLAVVVVPSPLTSTAALVWAHVADVTVLSVRRFRTTRSLVATAAENLRAAGAALELAVLHDGSDPAGDEDEDGDEGEAGDESAGNRDVPGVATNGSGPPARPEPAEVGDRG